MPTRINSNQMKAQPISGFTLVLDLNCCLVEIIAKTTPLIIILIIIIKITITITIKMTITISITIKMTT